VLGVGMEKFNGTEVYEQFFKQANGLLCLVNVDGLFIRFNVEWLELLGIDEIELKNSSFMNFVHSEDKEKTVMFFEKLKKGKKAVLFENRYIRKDCNIKWVRWNTVATIENKFFFAIAYDVTEEKSNKAQADYHNKMVLDVFSQAPCLAAIIEGPEFKYTFANNTYYTLIGKREIIGKTVREAIPELSEDIFKILNHVYETGEKFEVKDLAIMGDWLSDGLLSEKFFSLVYSRFYDPQKNSYGIWTLALETTESKKIESLMRATERVAALGRMAAGVAHEINNPLSYVLGNLNLIEEKLEKIDFQGNSDARVILSMIKDAESGVLRIKNIVKSLKKLSGDVKSEEIEKFPLNEVIESAIEYSHNELKHRATVTSQIEKTIYLSGIKGEMNQVFLNMMINAGHAFKEGNAISNEINISAERISNDKVLVRIRDTGCGIPKENIEKIFDPFFTSKTAGEGTGLGLAICHKIITAHGGLLTVTSEVGIGTEFQLTLNCCESKGVSHDQNVIKINTQANKSIQASLKSKILILDDEEMIGKVITLLLADHETTYFSDATKALEYLDGGDDVDIIICDLMMPGMSGVDFYNTLMKRGQLHEKIIFMSGGACTPQTQEFIDSLTTPVIYKPFDSSEIKSLVSDILCGKYVHLKKSS
jgi:PAS domain S-box-containing protein